MTVVESLKEENDRLWNELRCSRELITAMDKASREASKNYMDLSETATELRLRVAALVGQVEYYKSMAALAEGEAETAKLLVNDDWAKF